MGDSIAGRYEKQIAGLKAQLAEREKFIEENAKTIGKACVIAGLLGFDASTTMEQIHNGTAELIASLKDAREALGDIKDWADLTTMVRKAEVMERALELIFKKAKEAGCE